MICDLHIHSIYSDGSDTPLQIAKLAKEKKLDYIAITDHDTLGGLKEKEDACNKFGVKLLKGLELSSFNGEQVHILGYNIDENNIKFEKELNRLKGLRNARMDTMLSRLKKYFDIEILAQEVEKTSNEEVGSMHLARALIKKGYAKSIAEAFNKFIGLGAKAYCGEGRQNPFEAVEMIAYCGGIPVLAHPGKHKCGLCEQEILINKLKDKGLLGIEAVYSSHTIVETKYYINLANRLNLFVSCGSDYHGTGRGELLGFSDYQLKENALEALNIKI